MRLPQRHQQPPKDTVALHPDPPGSDSGIKTIARLSLKSPYATTPNGLGAPTVARQLLLSPELVGDIFTDVRPPTSAPFLANVTA
jgi:hypothetical protein